MARRPRASNETLIELFLDMLAAERGASANTLDAYRRDLADFSADLAGAGGSIAAADSDALRAYLGRLAKRGLAPASVARRLSAIRQLYRFLYSEGHRGDDPAAVIEGPKRGRSLPKVLSIKQVDDLLAQARDGMKAEAKCRNGCARRGSIACWRCSTPPACASPSWWRCRRPRRGATSACWSSAARADASGWCRSTTRPSAP